MLSLTAPFASQPERSTCSVRTVDPFTGADLCKHRAAEHRGGGPKFTLNRFFNRASSPAAIPTNRKSPDFPAYLHLLNFSAFYLRQIAGQCCTAPETIRHPLPAATSAPFTLRAAACIAARLCCRVAVNLHQNLRSFTHCTRPVRHFRHAKRQSDAQPPHRAMPLFSGFRRSFPHLTRLFGAAVS
ncbi:Uncharacterised protein [Salmonella enterica subsp. houtenae serovar Houten]|nr:Uncharacterised protein [Salmonella enterica subsp. houtenae serovar Houten]